MSEWVIVILGCELACILSIGPQYHRLADLFRKPDPPLDIQ